MKEYSLTELRQGLDEGLYTSVELCEMYLRQIQRLNPDLNAVAELNVEWRQIAEQMDLELKLSGPRSPLHGIPIVIKDNINTADKMHTTAGSLALADLYADKDAFLVAKLRQAGAILLGKTNLSEFAYFMSYDGMPSGYSSRKGQVKNPYGNLDPLGSSTGSAVMVAANMIPIAVGTETNGSLIAPATNNSLCSIKPTRGLISRGGIIPITSTQDTAGPLGRTVKDIAILLDQLWGRDPADAATLANPYLDYKFADACDRDVSGLKIGLLAFGNRPYQELEIQRMAEAKATFQQLDIEVVDVALEAKSMKNDVTLVYEFKPEINRYLASVKHCTKMTSLADIIAFNQADPERCLKYGQSILVASEKTSGTLTEPEYWEARLLAWQIADEMNTLIDKENLDAVLLPYRTSHAPIAGNPCITVPAKSLIDLVPGNVVFIGRKWDDETLFAIASAYERSTHFRVPPVLPQE